MTVFEFPYFSAFSPFQPVGAAAAGSAIAMGFAGQMYGLAFGITTGAMNASSKLAKTEFDLPPMPKTLPNPYTFEWNFGSASTAGASKPATSKKAAKAASPAKPKTKEPVNAVPDLAKPQLTKAPIAKAAQSKSQPSKPAQSEAATLMPEDFTKPLAIAMPATPDDLKLISGIGPKLEKVLNGLGIWTFAQIAQWTPNEVAWVDDFLQFKGRIERDDWIAQAAGRIAGK